MTRVAVLPDLSVIPDRRKPIKLPMTYQVIFCGSDGAVVASDKREACASEFSMSSGDPVTKIGFAGKFAWCASGRALAKTFFDYLNRNFTTDIAKGLSVSEAIKFLEECSNPAIAEFEYNKIPGEYNEIALLCADTQQIFKGCVSPAMAMHSIDSKGTVMGQQFNLSSFMKERIYSPTMTVDALVTLAAYAIRAAHELDSKCIDGLDIAVYRTSESEKGFRFIETNEYWNHINKTEESLRESFAKIALPIKYKSDSVEN